MPMKPLFCVCSGSKTVFGLQKPKVTLILKRHVANLKRIHGKRVVLRYVCLPVLRIFGILPCMAACGSLICLCVEHVQGNVIKGGIEHGIAYLRATGLQPKVVPQMHASSNLLCLWIICSISSNCST